MKNSNSSSRNSQKESESQGQLPRQWDYLSKRLAQVQKGLSILQKKHTKLYQKFSDHSKQTNELSLQLTDQILNLKTAMPSYQYVKDQVFKNMQSLQNTIKSSCEQLIIMKIQRISLNFSQKYESIDSKIKNIFQNNKNYVDRAVFQLKQLLKKYVKQQNDLQKKIEKSSRQNSPSYLPRNSLSKSKSVKKLYENSHQSQYSQKNAHNVGKDWFQKSQTSQNKQLQNVSGNRVSYLRQKLKQFQKINKKYQPQVQKPVNKSQNEQLIKKMRNYRQYLQQSESQLQPSNILTSEDVTGSLNSNRRANYALF